MGVGQSVITAAGIRAMADAAATGKLVQPKYFRFSSADHMLDPTIQELVGWIEKDISLYTKINDNTVEFLCDVKPEEAIDYGRIAGLFLEDGTLFMLAKPQYPFPPSLRQTFKIQLVYKDAEQLLDFQYLPFYETEQDLRLNNATAVLSNLFIKLSNKVREMQQRVEAIYKKTDADRDALERKIEEVDIKSEDHLRDVEVMLLNNSAVLGNMILEHAQKNYTIKT